MRRLGLVLALLLVFGLAAQADAANRYVLASASGAGTGADWTNAYTALPSTLTRGDTYYIGDGTYGAYDFDDAASGTLVITIKKATASDHGTDTGWLSSFGDGQAVFGYAAHYGASSISTPYWTIDGNGTATTYAKTGQGIKFDTGPVFIGTGGIWDSYVGINLNGSGNVTLRYVEIAGHGDDGAGGGNDLLYASSAVSNITIQYCYLHDAGRTHLLSRGGTDWLLEHNVFYRNESCNDCGIDPTPAGNDEHAESWSPGTTSGVVYRYNLVEEQEGTAILCTLDNNPGPDNWEIYGNVFLNNQGSTGAVTTDSESSWTNVKIYNNTFINGSGDMGVGVRLPGGSSATWTVYNNLWYNPPALTWRGDSGAPVHDYNWFYPASGTGGDHGEANGQVGSGDPFLNLAGGDHRLAAATNTGIDTSASVAGNSLDLTGGIRGTGGVWDRGAYEFGSGASPAAPTNVRIR
jgi:hypothetical protein